MLALYDEPLLSQLLHVSGKNARSIYCCNLSISSWQLHLRAKQVGHNAIYLEMS